jgi:hypothetical protein
MRRGPLDWLITFPADKLDDQSLSLAKLELFSPEPERLGRLLIGDGVFGIKAEVDVAQGIHGRHFSAVGRGVSV